MLQANEKLSLQVGTGEITLEEGAEAISVPVTITRRATDIGNVQLSAAGSSAADSDLMTATFTETSLTAGESTSNLSLELAIDTQPIQPQVRNWVVTASVDGSAVLSTEIDISIVPTSRPDL